MVKLRLHLRQEAVLSEYLLKDRGLCSDTKHFNVVVWWHVSLHYLHQCPESVLFVEHLTQTKHKEVESLDVSDCWVPPYVSLQDSIDGCLNFLVIERILWKGSRNVSLNFFKHLIGIVLQGLVL